MMCWPFWKPARHLFCSCKERSGKRTVLTTGICLYEGIYYGSRRYPAVHADNPQCHKEVKNGRNYLIFAEGTRSKHGNHPQEFKGGSFKAAMKAKCPIVPVALIDTYKAFDTGLQNH